MRRRRWTRLGTIICSIKSLVFIRVHHKSLEDIDIISFSRSAIGSNRWGTFEPCSSSVIISFLLQFLDFLIRPAGHGQRLASVTNGLMRRLAVVADKGSEAYANIAIAKFLLRAAIGANAITRKSSQLSNFLFCVGERHGVQWGESGRDKL